MTPARYPDPATLPPSARRGVRLHQHEPDRLWPWVFGQHQVWVDIHGHEHEIDLMPSAYVENVIGFCRTRALLIWALCVAEDEELFRRDLPDDLGSYARDWLEATPLMLALHHRREMAR